MKIGSSWLMGTTGTPSPFWGPAVTRTSRGVYECLVSIVLAIGVITFATIAQDSPPDDGDDDVEIVDWDLSGPVNHAESREFFAGRWAAEGAGLPAPDFEFTNTPPGLMFAMLLPELEVFAEIYRHRLQLDFDAGERYLATNLIAADADIRAEFRAFVLTGKLAPRPEIDAGAYLAHYMLVLDAVTAQERASVVSVEVFGALVESEGMSVEAPPPASTTVHQTLPPAKPHRPRGGVLAEASREKFTIEQVLERPLRSNEAGRSTRYGLRRLRRCVHPLPTKGHAARLVLALRYRCLAL